MQEMELLERQASALPELKMSINLTSIHKCKVDLIFFFFS